MKVMLRHLAVICLAIVSSAGPTWVWAEPIAPFQENDDLRLMLLDNDPTDGATSDQSKSSNVEADSRVDGLNDGASNGSKENASGSEDASAGESSAQPSSNNSAAYSPEAADERSTSAGEARLAQRLAVLRKPSSQLTLGLKSEDPDTADEPKNIAADLLSESPVEYLSADFLPIPQADRVHTRFCHRPTYFQELNLERCGQLDCEKWGCLQNAYSSFWFLTNSTLLPYRVASQPSCQCVQAYGDCTTCQRYDRSIEPLKCGCQDKSSVRGFVVQAATVAGFVFVAL